MRFWATMRSPALSISALTAPVRLRAVASGLIIEKVRSIAMISSLQSVGLRVRGLYRRHPMTASETASDQAETARSRPEPFPFRLNRNGALAQLESGQLD